MQTRHLPTTEITIHPVAAHLPRPDVQSPEYRALLGVIAETGTVPRAVSVCGFRALDNLDILAAAKECGMITIPTVEVAPHDAPIAAIADLVARKHWTKSQIAYLAFPLLQPILDAAKARRVANLKKGVTLQKSSQVVDFPDCALSALSGATTAERLADSLGISRRTLVHAAQIHRSFDAPGDADFEDGELRAHFEPKILEQDENGHSVGLGAVVAGIAGYKATRGVTVIPAPQLTLWEERIEKMLAPSKFNGWDKLPADVRASAAKRFASEFFNVVPEEIQGAVLGAVKGARRAA